MGDDGKYTEVMTEYCPVEDRILVSLKKLYLLVLEEKEALEDIISDLIEALA